MFYFTPKTRYIGQKFFYFQYITSTNSYFVNHYDGFLEEGLMVLADYQSKGYGQKNRFWEAKKSSSLLFSILLRPSIKKNFNLLIQLTQLTSLAISLVLENYCDLKSKIKWPNDIYLSKGKCCGILTQNLIKKNNKNIFIIGIGLNINQEKKDFNSNIREKASSIFIETGKKWNREAILNAILFNIESFYDKWKINKIPFLIPEIASRLMNKGKEIYIEQSNQKIKGKIIGLTNQGFLLIKTLKGLKIISAGNIC